MKSVVLLLLAFFSSRVQGERIEKIEQCEARCSQGLPCEANYQLSFERCKNLSGGVNRDVFSNTSISTVMKCEERQRCSLHLRVSTGLQMNKHIRGIYVCIVTAGMMERCRAVRILRSAREKLVNQQVNFQDDCLEVHSGQDVHVTIKTWPHICDVAISRSYRVPDCSNKDIQRSVPECITGKIQYDVDTDRKELSVSVSDMLEDKDYQLRLCHKGFICTGTGVQAVLKKENPVKKVTLKYSRPVPCLCIEGWSIMTDAPRVRVCPFENRVEELWSGITFDPIEETLSWEATCHVNAVIRLCELQDGDTCQDFANSSQTYMKGKVTYSAVDPHPRLCMKFITEAGVWVKCPFSEGNFPAWDLKVSTQVGHSELLVTSQVKTSLALSKCTKTVAAECEVTHTTLVKVAKRADVKYGVTTLYCQPPCSFSASTSTSSESEWQLTHVVVPVVALTTALLVVAMVTGIAMIVYQITRITKARGIGRLPRPHTGSFLSMTEAPNSKTQLACKSVFFDICSSGTSQFKHCVKSNLLNDSTNLLV
ncbi:putative interleukin-17 receptor E-like isoform X2 [Colossoma macropomum]|uniref:putative interleukin-17 receptor E-like isoform X2 n=1 Tax=Colossoma macropomum TaxID=42526 RepID=UPI001864D929|nr:putative interleukin-17 receptor E-like isoform X2 [Colossoma macropomum]